MMRFLFSILITAITLCFSVNSFGAEVSKLRLLSSIYTDVKGGGIKQPEGVVCNDKAIVVVADTGNGRLLTYSFHDGVTKGGEEIKLSELPYPIKVQINSKDEILVLDGKSRRIVRLGIKGEKRGYLDPQGISNSGTVVPRSFKVDTSDNVYILDIFSGRVIVLDTTGKFLRQVDFPEKYGFFSDLAVNTQGVIYLLDSVNAMVFSADKNAKVFSPLTIGMKEYMNFPTSLTVDNSGTIYISDQNGDGIVIIAGDGSFRARYLSMGWKEGLLHYPSQLCINGKGEMFIADRDNSRIQIFTTVK